MPQLFADVDRVKAKRQGVPLSNVFDTLQAYLGSVYVNDFNRFGRTYRVYAQAEAQFRSTAGRHRQPEDAQPAAATWCPWAPWPTSSFEAGPDRVSHYNVYLAADINGGAVRRGSPPARQPPPWSAFCKETLPNGFGYEWTDLTFQQKTAGNTALLVFPICVMLVFLILSAQYESWALPLAVILIVPDVPAVGHGRRVFLKGSDNNVLTQIGFIVLVGLACKNAILIVEFARERRRARLGAGRGGDRSLPLASASHPHDLLCVHHGRGAAGHRERRGQRNASGDRYRGVLRACWA